MIEGSAPQNIIFLKCASATRPNEFQDKYFSENKHSNVFLIGFNNFLHIFTRKQMQNTYMMLKCHTF